MKKIKRIVKKKKREKQEDFEVLNLSDEGASYLLSSHITKEESLDYKRIREAAAKASQNDEDILQLVDNLWESNWKNAIPNIKGAIQVTNNHIASEYFIELLKGNEDYIKNLYKPKYEEPKEK